MTIEARTVEHFLDSPAVDAPTWRVWIREVLLALVDEGEGFSGKRPLGNSGWEHELAEALCEAGLVEHSVEETDDDELVYDFSWGDVNDAWRMVIDHVVR